MSRTPRASPAERLLTLVAILLDAHGQPITFEEIQARMDGQYGAPLDPDTRRDEKASRAFQAARRKFERDKALLAELGIDIRFSGGDPEAPDTRGYVLDPADVRMPEVPLDQAELRLLLAAVTLAGGIDDFPLREDLKLAIAKIEAATAGIELRPGDEDLAVGWHFRHAHAVRAPDIAPVLELLGDAVVSHTRVRIRYRAVASGQVTDREVEPYGLWLRRGVWSFVGRCRLRESIRTFDVHRVLLAEAASPPGAFEVPADFDLDAWSEREPWELDVHAPLVVRLRLDRSVAGLADQRFRRATRLAARPDGSMDLDVRVSNIDPLLGLVLSLWGRARVIGPPEAVARLRARVDAITAAHAPPGGDA